MNAKKIIALVIYYFYSFKRNPARFVFVVLWPTFDLLIWGFTSVYLIQNKAVLPNFTIFVLSAFVFWAFLTKAQQELPNQLMDDISARSFSNILIAPLTLLELLTGLIVASLIKIGITFLVFAIVILGLYSFNIFQYCLLWMPYILSLLIFGWILGIVVSAFVIRFGFRAQFLAPIFAVFIQPFSCVFYSPQVLPPLLRAISVFCPARYVFDSMRGSILQNNIQNSSNFWISMFLNFVYFCLSAIFFMVMFRWAKKSGSLIRV